ncbi:MAG: retropepsin-like aspartic protease [Planctomycetota bacterium]|jgi:membrane-associated protease RseP (regulator of RpoE activity)
MRVARLWRWSPAFALALGVPLVWSPVAAQDAPAPAQAERPVHRIAYEHGGGVSGAVMVIRTTVDGVDTRLLFDTGAAFPLIIDTEVAKERGITGYYSAPVHGVGKSRIHITSVESLEIGKYRHGSLTAGIMDISHIRRAMGMLGTRIDGIVGMPVISGFRRVRIDFGRRRFELEEFGANEALPAELTAVRAEFGRDLKAVAAIRAKTAGGLGVQVEPGAGGLRLTEVAEGSVAATAGLRVGDRLTAINDTPLGDSPRDLRIAEALAGAGTKVSLQYTRDGQSHARSFALGAWTTGAPAKTPAGSKSEDF